MPASQCRRDVGKYFSVEFIVFITLEPVPCTAWDTDEISRLDFDCNNRRVSRMNVENSASLNDETYLILVVPVFAAEPREHCIETRCLRVHVDNIGGHIPAARLQLLD